MKTKIARIIILLQMLTLYSCLKTKNDSFKEKVSEQTISKSVTKQNEILEEMRLNRMEDTTRVITLINNGFFRQSTSSVSNYAIYFNYLLKHDNEEYDEAVSEYTYDMIVKYPKKIIELDNNMEHLSKEQQDKILKAITASLVFYYLSESSDSTYSESDFAKKFPYLVQKGCLIYYKQVKDNMYP